MTVAAAVLVPSPRPAPRLAEAVQAALGSGADEVLVVLASREAAAGVPEGVTVLLDAAGSPDEASAARVALDWSARAGHTSAVVAFGEPARSPAVREQAAWAALVEAPAGGPPVLVGVRRGQPAGLVRLEAPAWTLLPLSGALGVLWRARPELAAELDLTGLLR